MVCKFKDPFVNKRKVKIKEEILISNPEKSPQWKIMSKNEKSLYRRYRKGAESRNKLFKIGLLHFKQLIKSKCFYCGSKPFQKHNDMLYMGIDRVNNSKGYEYGNVISCCKVCNYAKGSMDEDSFHSWIHNISEEYKLRKEKVSKLSDIEFFQSRGFSINPNLYKTDIKAYNEYLSSEHSKVCKDYLNKVNQILTVDKVY